MFGIFSSACLTYKQDFRRQSLRSTLLRQIFVLTTKAEEGELGGGAGGCSPRTTAWKECVEEDGISCVYHFEEEAAGEESQDEALGVETGALAEQ